MGSLSYQVPAGLDVQDFLTFVPKAVVISNYTPFYIYLPDSLSYCPPWTSGAIFPLAHATRARAIWTQSPFGEQTIFVPAGTTYSASLSFTDDDLPLAGGTTIPNPTAVPVVDYFSVSYGTGDVTLLSAPGVGFRYRISHLYASPNVTTAFVAIELAFIELPSTRALWLPVWTGVPGLSIPVSIIFPGNGLLLAENCSLRLQLNGVGLRYSVGGGFFIDPV